jgi:hypothetical protein
MRASTTHSYQARRPVLLANPMGSIPLFRPVHAVMGWSEAQKAEFCVQRDRNNLAAAERAFAGACDGLGRANKMGGMKRHYQAKAMGHLNRQRAALRAARLALAASLANPALALAAA